MSYCKDCQHWAKPYRFWHEGHVCTRESDDAYPDAYAHDDSGLETALITKPNFGCMLFQARDTNE